MHYSNTFNAALMQEWLQNNLSVKEVKAVLKQFNLDEVLYEQTVREFRKKRNEKRQINGFILLAIGAFLGFLSCVCSITKAFPALYDLILYGVTLTAILIIFYGLYLVFED